MKKDVIIISIIALLLIAVGAYFILNNKSSSTNISSENATVLSTDLAKHNLESDCWVSFRGKVLDLTEFLPKHPGSAAAIIPYCGTSTEFENAFLAKHGEAKVKFLMIVGKLMGDFKVVGNLN